MTGPLSGERVFPLQHSYVYGEESDYDEVKTLGIYSTRELAEAARDRYAQLPGFMDLPLDCLEIQEFVIDRDMVCTEGFSFPPHHVNAMSEDEAWPD